ncbi:MAG: hypothetical protein ABJH52_14660 [Henriciella sp.]
MEHVFSLLVSLVSSLLAVFRGNSRSQPSNSMLGKSKRRISTERSVLWGAYYSKKTVNESSEWDGRSKD